MNNNAETFRIETVLLSEVEAARGVFAKVRWKTMDDAERAQMRANFIRALDRLSNFILKGVIPSDVLPVLSDECIVPPPRRPVEKIECQPARSSNAA
jgi:hypothetical protein